MRKTQLIIWLISFVVFVNNLEAMEAPVSVGYHVDPYHDMRREEEKLPSFAGGGGSVKGPSLAFKKASISSSGMQPHIDMRGSPLMLDSRPVPFVSDGVQFGPEGGVAVQPIKPVAYVRNNPSTATMIDPNKVADAHPVQRVEIDGTKLQAGTYASTVKQHGPRMTAPIHDYVDTLAAKYVHVAQVVPELFTTYATDFIKNSTFTYNPQRLTDYSYRDWSSSDSLNNVFMGMKFLNTLYGDSSFHLLNLDYKAADMAAPMREYVTALRGKYPHVPDVILLTYATEYVRNPANLIFQQRTEVIQRAKVFGVDLGSYEQLVDIPGSGRYLVDNIGKDLVLPKIQDSQNLDTSSLTDIQKTYLTMQAIEAIHVKPEHVMYKTPVNFQRLDLSFQEKMDKALITAGSADRLLLKCGVDIANIASPTAAQSAAQIINNQLKLHNPTYVKFARESNNGTKLLLDGAQKALFEQFIIDFVLLNQDIDALQVKKTAARDMTTYDIFLKEARDLRDKMNDLIIKQRTIDEVVVKGPLHGTPIDDAIAQLPIKEPREIDLNETTSVRDRLHVQDDMVLHNVRGVLRAIQKTSEAFTTGDNISAHDMSNPTSPSILVFYQEVNGRLTNMKSRLTRNPTLTEVIEDIKLIPGVLWDQLRAQLTMDLGVEQATAQRIHLGVEQQEPALWGGYLIDQQDPISVILKQLEIGMPVVGSAEVKRAITNLEVQYRADIDHGTSVSVATQRIESALNDLYDRNNKLESLKVYADVITALRPKILRKQAIEAQIKKWVEVQDTSIEDVLAKATAERDKVDGYENDIWAEEIQKLHSKKADEMKVQEHNQRINDKIHVDTERLWALDPTKEAIDSALEELRVNLQDIQGSDKDKSDAAAAIRFIQEYNRSIKDQMAVGAFVRGLHALKSKLEAVDVCAGIIPKLEQKIIVQDRLNVAIDHQIIQLRRDRTIQEAIDAAQKELETAVEANRPKLEGAIQKLQQEQVVEDAVVKKNKEIKDAALKLIPPLLDPLVQNPVDVALKQLQAALTEGDQPELAVINKLIMQYDDGNINLAEFARDIPIVGIRQDGTFEKQVQDILNELSKKKDVSEITKTYAQVVIELDRLERLKEKRSNSIAGIVEQLAPITTPQETYRLVVENIVWIENKLNEVLRPNGKVAQLTQQELKVQIDEFKQKLQDKNIGNIKDIKTLIKLYEDVLQQLKIDKDIADVNGKFNQGRIKLGQALQKLDASKAVGGVVDIGAGVAEAVWAGLDAMGLKKENFSKEALASIAVIITGISGLLITIQNNQHMTAEEKKKAQNAAFKAGFMDIANVAIADQTGASANVIATGNAEAIAMDAGFNRIINMLVPNDPSSYSYNSTAITSGDYMGNLNKFKTNYEELEQKQAAQQPYSAIPVKKTSGSYGSSNYGSSYSSPYNSTISSSYNSSYPYSSTTSYNSSLYPSYPSIDDLMSIGA